MAKYDFKFSNGEMVKEKVTGFTGTITGCVAYLTGCNQYLIIARSKDESSEAVAQWYDEGRLELIGKGIDSEDVAGEKKGCDQSPPGGNKGM